MLSARCWMALAIVLLLGGAVSAQDVGQPGQVELQFTGGACKCFLDEKFPDYWLAGGSLKFYVAKRVAIQPEYIYRRFMQTRQFQDYIGFTAIPHLVIDLAGKKSRVQPYVLGGVGLLREREKTGTGWIQHPNRVVVQGGVGTKVFLSKRVYVAPEVRLGYRQLVQVLGNVGFVLN